MQTSANLQQPRLSPNEPRGYPFRSRSSAQISASIPSAGSAFDILEQQISGSLQTMGFSETPRRLSTYDPYSPSPEQPAFLLLSVPVFDSGLKPGQRSGELNTTWEKPLTSIAIGTPKIVAAFVGRADSFVGDSAIVILTNEQTGERLESQCDADVLRENGIDAGDEFRCEVVRSKGTTAARLSRIPPKTLSKERVQEIRASFKDRWQF